MRRWVVVFVVAIMVFLPLFSGFAKAGCCQTHYGCYSVSSSAQCWYGSYSDGVCCDDGLCRSSCTIDPCQAACEECQLGYPGACDMCDECRGGGSGGGGGGSDDDSGGGRSDCRTDGCPTGKICDEDTGQCRLPDIGESCDSNVGCAEGQCLPGCAGQSICCKRKQGAYCEDPPGQARRSYCGNQSGPKANPNLTTCYGCFDTQGDCYAVGDCVTSPACSSGWAKCKLWNNDQYGWGCAAPAECGSSGGGSGDWGGTDDGGNNDNPTPPPMQFDLLDVRVDLLHDGSHPEIPILRVECDSEIEVDGLEVVLEPIGSTAGSPSPSPTAPPGTTSTVPGPITIPGTKPGPVQISGNAVSAPGVPVRNDTDQGGDRNTGSLERVYTEDCRFDSWQNFTAIFYCNYGEKGQSRATCRFTGDQNLCETCEVSEIFTIPEPILAVSVDKQAAKIGENIEVSMTGRSWIYVDRVDLLVDGRVARTFDHAGQRLLNIRDSTSIQLPKGRHEIAFRATDFVGDFFGRMAE